MSEIPWPHNRCILCLAVAELTKEHIIPQQIGGPLWGRLLCKRCNDFIGHTVESAVKKDPSIRLAVDNLEAQIPELARAIREGQQYVVKSPGGTVRARQKSGELRVRSERFDDGSIIQPTSEVRAHITNEMRKRGMSKDEIKDVLERFEGIPENVSIELIPGLGLVKWKVEEVHPALDGPMLSEQVLLKIAYEFFACHAGGAIYRDAEQLANLREALRGKSTADIKIERLITRNYRPLHGLALEDEGHVVVHVCLFGRLHYRVHLSRVQITRPFFAYTCHLDSGVEEWGIITKPKPAKQG